jgi:perosamine synthetase
MMQRIPVSGPSITQKEIDYVTDAVTRCWYGQANEYHERFERAFAEYIGVRHAVTLPSCTSAIHLSLLALGVGTGDEVIVPDCTWIASSAPIKYVGATTVFADIDPQSWCLSVDAFERAITPRTKAVIPVDLYGNMPDFDAIRAIARRHNIAVIEDSAEAIGSEFHGRRAGGLGDAGTFSFHGSKTLTTGEGGMLVTDRRDVYERVLVLRDHGRRPNDKMFWNTEVGYKYKMSSMQAALGLAQLERIDELVARKREIFSWYADELRGLDAVTLNHEAPGVKNTYWMVTAVLRPELGIIKEALIERLSSEGIDARPFFYPLSMLPAYEGTSQAQAARQQNHVSYTISAHAINLPCGMNMTRELVSRVCDSLRRAIDQSLKRHRAA